MRVTLVFCGRIAFLMQFHHLFHPNAGQQRLQSPALRCGCFHFIVFSARMQRLVSRYSAAKHRASDNVSVNEEDSY
jgi:hypothetical protein